MHFSCQKCRKTLGMCCYLFVANILSVLTGDSSRLANLRDMPLWHLPAASQDDAIMTAWQSLTVLRSLRERLAGIPAQTPERVHATGLRVRWIRCLFSYPPDRAAAPRGGFVHPGGLHQIHVSTISAGFFRKSSWHLQQSPREVTATREGPEAWQSILPGREALMIDAAAASPRKPSRALLRFVRKTNARDT